MFIDFEQRRAAKSDKLASGDLSGDLFVRSLALTIVRSFAAITKEPGRTHRAILWARESPPSVSVRRQRHRVYPRLYRQDATIDPESLLPAFPISSIFYRFCPFPSLPPLRQHTHPQQPDEIFPQSELTYGINAPTRLPIVNTRTHRARCRSYNTPIFLDLKPTAAASFYAIVNGLPPLCGPRPAPTLGSGCSRFSLSGPDVYGGRFEPSTTQVELFRGLWVEFFGNEC